VTVKFTERCLQRISIAQLLARCDLTVRENLNPNFFTFGEQHLKNLLRRLVAKQLSERLLVLCDPVLLN